MDTKKWPILAQILIALGCLGGIRGILSGAMANSILDIVFGVAILVIFWSVYKLKPWALMGLTIVLSLNIILMLINIFGGMPIIIGIIMIALNGFIIYYFNSSAIKSLFSA